MTGTWLRLNLVGNLSVLAFSAVACGGRANDDGNNPGVGGQTAVASGGRSDTIQGGQAQGGQAQAQGGQAQGGKAQTQGGQAQGGQALGGMTAVGGKPTTGGSAAVGGSAQGGSATGECTHQGQRHKIGEIFAAGDICNTCRCTGDGTVVCTRRVCEVCPDLDREYAKLFQEAKRCDPKSSVQQCQQSMPTRLACGCNSFVNSTSSAVIERMKQMQVEHTMNWCAEDADCGSCGEGPAYAFCSAEGQCQDRWDKQRNCMVSGQVYPHGTTAIPDPGSCNNCICDDGNLSCTEIDCPGKCPEGTAVGMQCAECTPMGACLMPDYECLPTCTDSCPKANQVCVGGLCKSAVCG